MIDTHCHLDDPLYEADWDDMIAAQKAAGVERILVPGVDATNIDAVRKVCLRSDGYLLPAIGLHPENVREDWQEQLEVIRQHLFSESSDNHIPYIAVGEIGLDYHFDTTFKSEQQQAFLTQLQWATDKNLPVMIHSRDATEDCLRILRQTNLDNARQGKQPIRGVMHCFSGSREVAQQIVQMGLYLGIGGVITFKNCQLKFHLQGIPLERLVLETDAPYMTPVPFRGKRNESRFMRYVVAVLSEVYQVSEKEIESVTSQNAKQLFL
ncbi:MAG: TatD family hydrolase [Paludibacteraceae bacterium]|nr:TatD family hydrolase [Paludibacteraceae bacterium]